MRRHILREISSNPNAVQLSKNRSSLRGPEAGRTVFPNVLSEVEGRAQHEREDLQCLYNYGPINNPRQRLLISDEREDKQPGFS